MNLPGSVDAPRPPGCGARARLRIDGTWFASDGSSAQVSSAAHQGRSSLSFATNGRGTLSSAPFSFEKTPNVLDFAVRSPSTSSSAPTSAAEVEALLTCEEREVRGASLGRAALAGFQGEGFKRVAFSVPAALKDRLAGGCGALVVRLVVRSAEGPATGLRSRPDQHRVCRNECSVRCIATREVAAYTLTPTDSPRRRFDDD